MSRVIPTIKIQDHIEVDSLIEGLVSKAPIPVDVDMDIIAKTISATGMILNQPLGQTSTLPSGAIESNTSFGNYGQLFDPNNDNTLWQDFNKTVPATINTPVAVMTASDGTINYEFRARGGDNSKRPTLRYNSTTHSYYLQFLSSHSMAMYHKDANVFSESTLFTFDINPREVSIYVGLEHPTFGSVQQQSILIQGGGTQITALLTGGSFNTYGVFNDIDNYLALPAFDLSVKPTYIKAALLNENISNTDRVTMTAFDGRGTVSGVEEWTDRRMNTNITISDNNGTTNLYGLAIVARQPSTTDQIMEDWFRDRVS